MVMMYHHLYSASHLTSLSHLHDKGATSGRDAGELPSCQSTLRLNQLLGDSSVILDMFKC